MALNLTQLQALKASIAADPALSALPRSTLSAVQIAIAYNADASPVEKAWISSASRQQLDSDADYSNFDSVVAGKRAAWDLFLAGTPRNMKENKARKLIEDVWGASNATNTNAFKILTACSRNITRAEALLGGSTTDSSGSGAGTVTAKKLSWEGAITSDDVEAAWGV